MTRKEASGLVHPVGSLVIEEGAERVRHALRMVIGHKDDGRCMTVLVDPPPWLTAEEREHIHVVEPSLLHTVEPDEAIVPEHAVR